MCSGLLSVPGGSALLCSAVLCCGGEGNLPRGALYLRPQRGSAVQPCHSSRHSAERLRQQKVCSADVSGGAGRPRRREVCVFIWTTVAVGRRREKACWGPEHHRAPRTMAHTTELGRTQKTLQRTRPRPRPQLDPKLGVKPLAVRPVGRAHLACLRCRTQKIKCSGGEPACENCVGATKACRYPQREKKVTLLESQLDGLAARIEFLEARLAEAERGAEAGEPGENGGGEAGGEAGEAGSIPFRSFKTDRALSDTYFGTSSGQVFDSELKSHLFAITRESEAPAAPPAAGALPQRRHFFKDPSLDSPFSGIVMLPDKTYALQLVATVVSFLGHEYYLFDAEQLYAEIDEAYERLRDKKPLWICYFLITLAVGEQYMAHSPSGDIPGMGFYMAAMRLYKSSYEEPTLQFVQTLILIAFYLQGLNSANAAFSFYGLAMRSALIQGLHRKLSFLPPPELERRKRLWWTIFIMDSIWCSNLGHPIHVQFDDVDVDLPGENVLDLHDGFDIELSGYNVRLAQILGTVMRDVYRPCKGATTIEVKTVLCCVDQLDQLQKLLPARVQNNLLVSENRSTANLYLRLNQYIVVTTRPLLLSLFEGHVQPTDAIKRVVSRCVTAAILNIDILANLQNNGWLSAFGFWDAQYCFSSLIILVICSFSGNRYPQVHTGRRINTYMKDAGNFTAIDNEHRLLELDDLMSKIPGLSAVGESQNGKATPTSSAPTRGEKAFDPKIVFPTDSSPSYDTDTLLPPDVSKASATGSSLNPNTAPDASVLDSNARFDALSPNTRSLFQQQSLSDFISDMRETCSGSIGDFAAFRNNVSPDTWNELASNLQFWDHSGL